MNLKINFCGDSFCASKYKDAWCNILSNKINAKTIGLGKSGSAHEYAIKSFNSNTHITIFCWTEPNRLYHKKYEINSRSAETYKDKIIEMKIATEYYKYLHDFEYAEQRQIRDLYWFDNVILSQYKGKIIHYFGFNYPTYKFKNGYTHKVPIDRIFKIKTSDNKYIFNHLSIDDNKKLAQFTYKLLQNSC
jgi:hypothetical protein